MTNDEGRGARAAFSPELRRLSFVIRHSSLLRLNAALAALGLVELALGVYGAHAQGKHRIITSLGAALAQAVPYLVACALVLRVKTPAAGGARRSTLRLALGFALAFRLVALGTAPYLSTDLYRYVWDGRVQAAGVNPYRFVPADPALATLRAGDDAVYPHINRKEYARTIYPPGAQVTFWLVTRLLGESAWAMKAGMVGFEILALWMLGRLLGSCGLPVSRLLLYAWHPLPVWEFAGSGHLDAAMIAALAAALLLVRRRTAGRETGAGVALAAATLMKFFPVALLPALWRRPRGPWLPAALAGAAAVAYLPYLGVGWRTIFEFLLTGYSTEEGLENGERFFLLALAQRLSGSRVPTTAFYGFALAALGALAAWVFFARERDGMSCLRRAAALAVAFQVLLSPGYAWYFAWLVMFLPFLPHPALFWLTTAAFALYANWLHTTLDAFFAIGCVLYLPAGVLAAAGWLVRRRPVHHVPPSSVP